MVAVAAAVGKVAGAALADSVVVGAVAEFAAESVNSLVAGTVAVVVVVVVVVAVDFAECCVVQWVRPAAVAEEFLRR